MSINNLSEKSAETVSTKRISEQDMITLENGLQKDHEVEEAIGQTNENISSLYKEISPLKKHIYAEVHTSLASRYKEKDNKDQTVHQQHLQSFSPLLQNDYGKAVIIGKIEQMTFGYESFRERLASGKSFSPYQENLAMLYLYAADLYEGTESNESQEISLPILDTTKLQSSIALFTQIQQHIAEYTQYTSSGLSKSPQELVSSLHPENDFARTHALAEVLQKTDVVQKFLTADQPFADLDDIAATPQEHTYLQLYLKITRSSSLQTVEVSANRSATTDESPATPKQPHDYTDRAYYINPAATFSVIGASEQFKNERNSIVSNIVIEARKKAMEDVINGTITMERKNEDGSVSHVPLLEAARQGCEFNLRNMISSNGFKKEEIKILSPAGIDREKSHFSDEELNPEGEVMRD